jgi:hypothetical protein
MVDTDRSYEWEGNNCDQKKVKKQFHNQSGSCCFFIPLQIGDEHLAPAAD